MSKTIDYCGEQFKIPEILNWEDYRYAYEVECKCRGVSWENSGDENAFKYAVGYANTRNGLMLCFECPKCGERIRWHIKEFQLSTVCIFHPEWCVK